MAAQGYDAVVVGAGPNGLVAANHLADAGWSVLVLEAQPEVGGAVRSDRGVHPDYVHDLFSAFYPLAAASETIRSFHLEDHGLTWVHAPAVLGNPLPGGEWALLHRDREVTAALADAAHPGDGQAWLDFVGLWDLMGDAVVRALLSPFPPVRAGLSALRRLPAAGGLDYVRMMLSPITDIGRQHFGGEAPRILLAGNAGHADIPLDGSGSGVLGVLLCMLGQTVGFPVPQGGAGVLSQALAARLRAAGGEILCDAEVTRIEIEGGRAVAVRTADHRYVAKRAVLADVVASKLYGGLVPDDDLPDAVRRQMRYFELDPGTVKVDWALDGPVPWSSPPPYEPGTFHVADSVEQMSEALAQVTAGVIPARPFMLAGQMTTTDPTRSPAGTESLWAYTHVPHHSAHDAAAPEGPGPSGGAVRGVWDRDDYERFADRMQARIEEHAPDFASRVVARRVLGPHEIEAHDANLIGGAVNGGTANLQQQLVFRPVPSSWGRAESRIGGLYLASASAHPGGGVHGAPGMNAARAALAHHRVRALTRRGR